MKREIEFKGTKSSANGNIDNYIYARSEEQKVEAVLESKSGSGNKSKYVVSIWVGDKEADPILKIFYPSEGLSVNVTENFKKAKDVVMPVGDFLELISSKANVIEAFNDKLIVRSAKKSLASDINAIHTFEGIELSF